MWTGTVVVVWALALSLIAYGASHDIFGVVLEPKHWEDTLRYVNVAGPAGPGAGDPDHSLAAGRRCSADDQDAVQVVADRRHRDDGLAGLTGYLLILGNVGELALMAGVLAAAGQERSPNHMSGGDV